MVNNETSGYPELQILTDRPLIRDDDDYLGSTRTPMRLLSSLIILKLSLH
jgi:hypothetical protein